MFAQSNGSTIGIRTLESALFLTFGKPMQAQKMIKSKKRGGSRRNAGAKPQYSEKTQTVSFRCPESKISALKEAVKSILLNWVKSDENEQ